MNSLRLLSMVTMLMAWSACAQQRPADPAEAEVACQVDGECPRGELCVQALCVPGCHDDADCPQGEPCGANGQCGAQGSDQQASEDASQVVLDAGVGASEDARGSD